MLPKKEIIKLTNKSYTNRITLLNILKKCGDAHLGGASSAMDILTVLYEKILNHDPLKPKWDIRDIFILSAGHKAVGLYVVLQSQGYFEKKILWTYNSLHTKVPMHPDEKLLPGVEFPTGSLGHGLSVAGGIAHAFKMDGSNRKVYVLMGDGESAEGSVWEAVLSSAKYKLDNLTAIIDVNGLQSENFTKDILPIAPFEDKFTSFGWSAKEVNGNSIAEIYNALTESPFEKEKPTCIIANTIKGKGVDFAENSPEYHHWAPPSDAEANLAIESIKECQRREIDKIV